MKYMTKEWYKTMQNTSDYLIIRHVGEKYNKVSEEIFKELYTKEKQIKDKIFHFGEPKMYKDFNDYFNSSLNRIRKLPDTILNEVSDVRLLALGYATQKNYDRIKEYCINNSKIVEKTVDDYAKYIKKEFKNKIPNFEKESFHDSQITNFIHKGNDYIFELDNEGSFTEINNIIFKNAEIIKQEFSIKDARWLYNEIYKIGDKYEIHLLLWASNDELIDFILTCDDIILNKI